MSDAFKEVLDLEKKKNEEIVRVAIRDAPKLGDFRVTDKPDPPCRLLEITIHSGEVFEATDLNGLSDPYVVVTLANPLDHIPSDKWTLKTPVCKKTLKPEWNYTNTTEASVFWNDFSPDGHHCLKLKLKDQDLVRDEVIGKARVTLQLTQEKGKSRVVTIDKRKIGFTKSGSGQDYTGSIELTVKDITPVPKPVAKPKK